MAACYIKAMQAVQPLGPYILVGHSFGSWVAFEMAKQVQEKGHEIALLAVIDFWAPMTNNPEHPGASLAARQMLYGGGMVSLVKKCNVSLMNSV